MAYVVRPGFPLQGEAEVPGDKSLSHRAALLAAMAEGESRIENFQVSGVTRPLLQALDAVGASWRLDGASLRVQGLGLSPRQRGETVVLDCGNSATTLRLLAGALAAWGLPAVLDGTPGLRRRPMLRIVEPLHKMGVQIQATDGCAPLRLQPSGKRLQGIQYQLAVASAQVKSCLLLAALTAQGETLLEEPGPSRDHSERMLRAMGVQIESGPGSASGIYRTRLSPPGKALAPLQMTLPGDISAAAFLIVAALITPGSALHLRRVGLNPTRTGLLDALQEMGADIQTSNLSESGGEPLGDLVIRYSPLKGVRVGGELVVRMIDEFPAFAIAAAYARGETIVRDAEELRHKESDRISALGQELRSLGVAFAETLDGFTIQGGKPVQGGVARSHGDHRLAMALAVAGLAAQAPVTVQDAQMVGESFPGFEQVLIALGAPLERQEML
jgi:3-phosphoshikimate 1-carboxyvinyltransferase